MSLTPWSVRQLGIYVPDKTEQRVRYDGCYTDISQGRGLIVEFQGMGVAAVDKRCASWKVFSL